MVYIYNSV